MAAVAIIGAMAHIGIRLRRWRKARNRTLEECASFLGVTPSALSKMERSGRIRAEVVERLAAFLLLPVSAIYEQWPEDFAA